MDTATIIAQTALDRKKSRKKRRPDFSGPRSRSSSGYCTLTWVMRVAQLPSEPRVLPQVKLVAT
jgi:hypothetical protein